MAFIPAICALLLLVLSAVSAVLIVRNSKASCLRFYGPLLIEVSLALVVISLSLLPQALPALFQRIVGHSIGADYTYVRTTDGIQVTETWLTARWWKPLGSAFGLAVFAGMLWAIWNLRSRAARIANLFALSLGACWLVTGVLSIVASVPFLR
jgi:hypothetical protein